MRFNEIKQLIAEVPMNPGAYASSLTTAVEKKVKIGFEFEVCVPHATIVGTPKESKDTRRWLRQVSSDWWKDLDIGEIDSDFAKMDPPIEYNGQQYTSLQSLANAYIGNAIADKVKLAFEKLPTNTRKKIIRQWNKMKEQGHRTNDAYQFGLQIQRELDWQHPVRNDLSKALNSYMSMAFYKRFWTQFFGTVDFKKIMVTPGYIFNDEIVKNDMGIYDEDDDDDDYGGYGNDYDYNGAAKVMEPALQKAFGKVIVFGDYHERTKKLDTWYIEPDGSLTPEDNDGACEIVSPPLPVAEGIVALKKFYEIAAQMKLYTSSDNHTGLHINVSIPDKLDVLKLALFVGDEHVLKDWGRLDSDYANSIMKSLRDEIPDQSDRDYDDDGQAKPYFNLNKKSQLDQLVRIAKNVSDDHMASVSMEGGNKYVSFRHAGGDYLNKQESVLNVVGRFVRAMVIAADPAAYRKEYLAKLTKLVTPKVSPKKVGQSFSSIMALKTTPFHILMFGLFATKANVSPKKLVNEADIYMNSSTTDMIVPADIATPILENILVKGMADSDFDNTAKQKVAVYKTQRALLAHLMDEDDIQRYKEIDVDNIGYYPRVGIQVRTKEVVQPGTPLHTLFFQKIFNAFRKEVKDRKAENSAVTRRPVPRRR